MLTFVRVLRDWVRAEAAQDAFEYVLIIGMVVVAVLVAIATPLGGAMIDAVIDGVCAAIDAMDGPLGITIPDGACTPP